MAGVRLTKQVDRGEGATGLRAGAYDLQDAVGAAVWLRCEGGPAYQTTNST